MFLKRPLLVFCQAYKLITPPPKKKKNNNKKKKKKNNGGNPLGLQYQVSIP